MIEKASDHFHKANDNGHNKLVPALVITLLFMFVEIAGGIITGSLALLADAGHMAIDNAALMLALWAGRQANIPATSTHTFGYRRYKILAAFINGLTLLLLSAWIIFEAVQRLFTPPDILGGPMLAVAAGGLIVNLVVFKILHTGRMDINVRVATAHVVGDLMGSLAAIVAAVIILATGWLQADPLLSIVVALIILKSGRNFVRETWHVLVEGIPPGFDQEALKTELPDAVDGVIDVHHIHAWSLTTEKPYFLTLHLTVKQDISNDVVLKATKEFVQKRFDIDHITIQVEQNHCPDHDTHHQH